MVNNNMHTMQYCGWRPVPTVIFEDVDTEEYYDVE